MVYTARIVAIAKASAAWSAWLLGEPSTTLRRLHGMTRVTTGWVPSPLGKTPRVEGEDEVGDEAWLEVEPDITEEAVQQSVCIPLGSQEEVDRQAEVWAAEWAAGNAVPALT